MSPLHKLRPRRFQSLTSPPNVLSGADIQILICDFVPFPSGLILLFYAALYAFLAAMFGGCLFCLMWSISPYHPTFNDRVMPPGK